MSSSIVPHSRWERPLTLNGGAEKCGHLVRHFMFHDGQHIVKGLVRRQQQQGARIALRKRSGRECLIVCLWDYATYLDDSIHTSTP
jgi:hypothetical protein